jgi:hypothetical protein
MMDESAKENFLAQWPQNKRATIMNQFLRTIREGANAPDQVLRWVDTDARKRLESPYCNEAEREAQELLLIEVTSDDGWRMAEYCLWWESLSRDEKTKIKIARGKDYAKQWMATQPPTPAQLKYLKALGCDDLPTTKAQASEWIDAKVSR